jgi:hypothetical protein
MAEATLAATEFAAVSAETYIPFDTSPSQQPIVENNVVVFRGVRRNMAMGVVMLAAGLAAFISGLTHTFFAGAMAWTFIFWGLFFLWGDLLETTRTFALTTEGLTINMPMRLWSRSKTWAWQDISRFTILIRRRDSQPEDVRMQVYHQYPNELALDREDTTFQPALALLIIQRAKLKPDGDAGSVDMTSLPFGQPTEFVWKR